MHFLINCSNLKKGGGLQVADSVCGQLSHFPDHQFVVVLSSWMDETAQRLRGVRNVRVVRHNIRNDWRTLLLGRDAVLDRLVENDRVDAVLTVFGPARWRPSCPHVCGFARAQLVLGNSPYYKRMAWHERLRERLHNIVVAYLFRRGVDVFWTENPYITAQLHGLFPSTVAGTVTNYYNQVFDESARQREHKLPPFGGCTLLSVNASYPHKNLAITIAVARCLTMLHPDFRFRFVLTVTEAALPQVPEELKAHFCLIGRVGIDECPSLYRQADIMFQPTLLECFTATYPEAMRMDVPIVTTDIAFARSLCGEAARYYPPLSATAAAEAIYAVATDTGLRQRLIAAGHRQLKTYDNYTERAYKLIAMLEDAVRRHGD